MHLVKTEVYYMYTKHNKCQRQCKNIFLSLMICHIDYMLKRYYCEHTGLKMSY